MVKEKHRLQTRKVRYYLCGELDLPHASIHLKGLDQHGEKLGSSSVNILEDQNHYDFHYIFNVLNQFHNNYEYLFITNVLQLKTCVGSLCLLKRLGMLILF